MAIANDKGIDLSFLGRSEHPTSLAGSVITRSPNASAEEAWVSS